MPQVVLFATLGALVYVGARALSRVSHQFSENLRRGTEEFQKRADTARQGDSIDGGTLEFDPVSGVYKPRKS